MFLKPFLFACCLGCSVLAFAQSQSAENRCQKAILDSEKQRNPQIYSQCGFDDGKKALAQWGSWAERSNAYQAMYELCIRNPNIKDGIALCQKAAAAGNGSALIYQADKLYDQKKYMEAFQGYVQALKSPTLTLDEKGHISEKIGVLYLNPESSYYNPEKGWPLIEKATQNRGALANNIVGVYSMLGMEKQTKDMKKAFEHLWRSVLLGCPNAEENLGLFYLVHQNTITLDDARQLMKNKIFTCQSAQIQGEKEYVDFVQQNCNCQKVMQKEQLASQYPYRLISVSPTGAVLQAETGERFTAVQDSVLPNGARISEIHRTALVVVEGQERHIISLAPDEKCVSYCKNKEEASKLEKNSLSMVKPYHFTFTPSECSDLLYYAERLVDTKLPFTGKKECGFSGELDAATQLLMGQ